MADPRYFYSAQRRIVLAANLKCGYATLNGALTKASDSTGFHCATDPKANVQTAERAIFFVREPKSRFLSFYRNWIIKRVPGDAGVQTVFRNIEKWFSSRDFQRLAEATTEEKSNPEFFQFFLHRLGPLVMLERHTAPQFWLYQIYGIDLDAFTEVYDFKENTRILVELGIYARIENRGDPQATEGLGENALLDEFCRIIYSRDYAELGSYFS